MPVDRKPNITVLVCSWRSREKTKGSHDMKSGNTNSMASSRPIAVPKTSHSADDDHEVARRAVVGAEESIAEVAVLLPIRGPSNRCSSHDHPLSGRCSPAATGTLHGLLFYSSLHIRLTS